jgi:hypothetical protein
VALHSWKSRSISYISSSIPSRIRNGFFRESRAYRIIVWWKKPSVDYLVTLYLLSSKLAIFGPYIPLEEHPFSCWRVLTNFLLTPFLMNRYVRNFSKECSFSTFLLYYPSFSLLLSFFFWGRVLTWTNLCLNAIYWAQATGLLLDNSNSTFQTLNTILN